MSSTDKTQQALSGGNPPLQIKNADDLALEALNSSGSAIEQEAEDSDKFAQTLHSLESIIESKANKLMDLRDKIKEKKEMLKNIFENDSQFQEAVTAKEEVSQAYKQRQSTLNETTQVRSLSEELRAFNEDIKDLEESLSNHLINYHQLTNSTSFDTSDGDQWDFQIKARVKSKRGKAE